MSRSDLETRYASLPDDELLALFHAELSDLARECADRELSRRGSMSDAAPVPEPAHSATSGAAISIGTPAHRQTAKQIRIISYFGLAAGVLFLIVAFLPLIPQAPLPGSYAPSGLNEFNPRMAAATVAFFALPALILSVGLRCLQPWARTIAVRFAASTLVSPASWYVLWVLTSRQSKDLFGVVPRSKRKGFSRFLMVAAYMIVTPFIAVINWRFAHDVYQAVTRPPAGSQSLRNVTWAYGSDDGYCGAEASARVDPARQLIWVKGIVAHRQVGQAPNSYVLSDGFSTSDRLPILANREFPMPSAGEKVEVLTFVHCSWPPSDVTFREAARTPWRASSDQEKARLAKAEMAFLAMALDLYRRNTGSYPTAAQGLRALRAPPDGLAGWKGPYGVGGSDGKDPWGRNYAYRYPGEHGSKPDLTCWGADGRPGGYEANADIRQLDGGIEARSDDFARR